MALAVNGSAGGVADKLCHTVMLVLTAKDRLPLEANVCGMAVASQAEMVAVPLQSAGPGPAPAEAVRSKL